MPHYLYRATDSSGRWLSGEIDGATHAEVIGRLGERGLTVESLEEAELPVHHGASINRAELVELVEHLSSLTRSGLPLPSGLRAAGLEVASGPLRSTFFAIADQVEAGGKLDEAIDRLGHRFPADLQSIIAAGSRTDRLAEMLAEFVRNANLRAELRRIFTLKLAYPGALCLVVIVLVGFLCSLASQTSALLGANLRNFGVDQPLLTRAMASMASFVNDHKFEMVGVLVAVPALAWLTLRVGYRPSVRRRILCSIPVVGPVMRFSALTSFCHLLAMLLEARMPLPRAFELAGSCVDDAEVAEACKRMGTAVEAGEPLSTAIRHWPTLPAGLSQLFRWSEDQSRLPDALHLAGDMFESRARSQSNYAGNVLATVLLLLIVWWIGFAIATIYLPLLSMAQMIQVLSG